MADFGQDDDVASGTGSVPFGQDDVVVSKAPSGTARVLGQTARRIGQAADFLSLPGQIAGEYLREAQGFGPSERPGEAVVQGMEQARIAADRPPETPAEFGGAAMGDAILVFGPMMQGLNVLRQGSGVTAKVAEQLYKDLATRVGFATEIGASGAFAAAEKEAKSRGASDLASLGAGSAAAVGTGIALGSPNIAPTALAVRGYQSLRRNLTPMTTGGAETIAAQRLKEAVGGERAVELRGMVDPNDPLKRTPAEQTGDPNLLRLQRAAAESDPALRERLAKGQEETRRSIIDVVRAQGGDVDDARTFFRRQTALYSRAIDERVREALRAGDDVIEGLRPRRYNEEMSEAVVGKLRSELQRLKEDERALWGEVDKTATLKVDALKDIAREISETTSIFQRSDIPEAVDILLSNRVGDTLPAMELHGLYSKMREIARNARFGTDRSDNTARLADKMADAADDLLETVPGKTAADARALTRAIHLKFDDGAPGRILARSRQGTTSMPEERALQDTVGRRGRPDAQSLVKAAPETQQEILGFLANEFAGKAIDQGTGQFNPAAARRWMANNDALLRDNPDLKREFEVALTSRERTAALVTRLRERQKALKDTTISQFNKGRPENAVTAIIGAVSPIKAAKSVVRQARKDPSGRALAGVQGAFADYLTSDVMNLANLMQDAKMVNAMTQVFDPRQMANIRRMSDAVSKMTVPEGSISAEVLEAKPSRVINMLVRAVAASQGSATAQKLGLRNTIQTPGFTSESARMFLEDITADKAREIAVKAITEDHELFRALMTKTPNGVVPPKAESKIRRYLSGTSVGATVGAAQPKEE